MKFVGFLLIFLNIFSFKYLNAVEGSDLLSSDYDSEDKYSPRIVGGQKARKGEMIGVVSVQTLDGQHFCGGTWFQVGNRSQILTAAHCIPQRNSRLSSRLESRIALDFTSTLQLQVMGDDLSLKSASSQRQIRKIRKVVTHPYYNPETFVNDIAILFLSSPFKETTTFAPVSLTNNSLYDYQPCTIAGWGKLKENQKDQTLDLMIANVSVIPRDICNGRFSYRGIVGRHAFCAGSIEGGTDSCQGDSGGGLMSNNKLVGIVSFGIGCARKNFPGVYTNVYHYKNWIQSVINSSTAIKLHVLAFAIIIGTHFGKLLF